MEPQTKQRGVEVFETTFECKDCGAVFYISREQQESMRARHLELPKRCVSCRRKRRHSRQNSNADCRAVNQTESGHIAQKPWDVADFKRVMREAREEIERWK